MCTSLRTLKGHLVKNVVYGINENRLKETPISKSRLHLFIWANRPIRLINQMSHDNQCDKIDQQNKQKRIFF